jgi:DNA-binding IclR family transcriptional regulator
LLEDVQRTRQQGYTVSLEDAALGIAAVGAPIRDHSGKIVAAISLSGLASRYDPQRIEQLAQIVTANASALSYQMGFRERS